MPCPFPGMDPYLEMQPYWGDFAPTLIGAIRNTLLPQLLPRYDVRIEEYLFVGHESIRLHRVQPDVTISRTGFDDPGQAGAVAVAEPMTAELEYPEIEPRAQRHLKIIHRPTNEAVTVMELLSAINKTASDDGLDAYLEKRAEYLASQCNLVELDLLRGGQRLPMQGNLPSGDYYAYVGRPRRRPRCQVFGWPLRSPLPTIPIPLLEEDPDVMLDLQATFTSAYDPGLYERRLPYDRPLAPKPSKNDAAWIAERLANDR